MEEVENGPLRIQKMLKVYSLKNRIIMSLSEAKTQTD